MKLGSFLHIIFGYVYSTSKYNEFGRVILKTPFPELNMLLIDLCLDIDSKYHQSKRVDAVSYTLNIYHPQTDKSKNLDLLRKNTSRHSIFMIKKNVNGHYKFDVLKEVSPQTNILVLIDSDPNETSTSSIGILTPHKTDRGLNNAFFTFQGFKNLVRKFGITVTNDNTLNEIAAMNAFNKEEMPKPRRVMSRIKQNFRAVKRGFKQYVLKESASMSKTLVAPSQ